MSNDRDAGDVIESAICRAFAYTDVPCPWNGDQWDLFVVALVKELARAGGGDSDDQQAFGREDGA